MNEYLSTTLNKLQTKDYGKLHIVLGNESCDLDSAVSSIVYALFLSWHYNHMESGISTERNIEDKKKDIFVPILNVNREDYALKTEVAYLLNESEVEKSNLVFRNDFDLKQLLTGDVNVILVDHHMLCPRDQYLAPYVVEIIDHRPIDKSGWSYREDVKTTIEMVGSCCTLIAQRIRHLSRLVGIEVNFFTEYSICSNILHSTIILDTVNLSKTLNKATPHDEEALSFLESLIRPNDFEFYRKTELERLSKARSDVSELSAAQLLKKDVKIIGEVLVPTFPILVQQFLERPGVVGALSTALSQRGCTIAVLIGIDLNHQMSRDMAVYSNDNTMAINMSRFLQDWNNPSFDLAAITCDSPCVYYKQNNLSATRKQYIPAIKEFLNNKY